MELARNIDSTVALAGKHARQDVQTVENGPGGLFTLDSINGRRYYLEGAAVQGSRG